MSKQGLFIALSGLVFIGAGCAPAGMEGDLKRLQAGVNDLRAFQAEQITKITTIDSELRALSGRVEELEFAQNKRLGTDLTALRQDLQDIRRRVPPPAIIPVTTLEADEGALSRMPQEIAPYFKDAFQQLREGKFADADKNLRDSLELSRGTEWAADTLFWIGIANEGREDTRGALEAYHGLVTNFPKHKKAPKALSRQAELFSKMGDAKLAKVTLSKLIADYPKTEEASRAKERVKTIR